MDEQAVWPPKDWLEGEPSVRGKYLGIDRHYWTELLLDWMPKHGWFHQGRKLQPEFVALYRPLPKLPPRPEGWDKP